MFYDRSDAGKKLAEKLLEYKNKNVIVLAIPRGGVPVAYEIAKELNAKLDILVSRKLPLPQDPEAGFGAISETGDVVLKPETISYFGISKKEIEKIEKQQLAEIKRRIKTLRKGRKLNLEGKVAILVDDGLAMGSTMEAAILAARNKKASKVVVAVPVAGYYVAESISKKADDFICLERPKYFRAVADAYENWYDLTDKDVLEIIERYGRD